MKAIVLTEQLARAIAQNAANAQMRKRCGRTLEPKVWNDDDYNLACETLENLWPIHDPEFRAALSNT